MLPVVISRFFLKAGGTHRGYYVLRISVMYGAFGIAITAKTDYSIKIECSCSTEVSYSQEAVDMMLLEYAWLQAMLVFSKHYLYTRASV
jgi:hypothetical protein